MTLAWLYVDFNSYFASVEQQINPKLRGKPVAVVPVISDSTSAIAASYEAKALGIKTGTPIWQAKKLCKNLICVLAKHDVYVEYHHKLLAEIERHIHITSVASIDEVACKLLNNENKPQQAIKIAQNIKTGIYNNVGQCLTSSIGIAPNKYLAKVATEIQKPNGLVVINANEIEQNIFKLKLKDLPGIGVNIERRLNQAGINTVERLYNHQPKHLRKIWHSVWGEKMWYLLHGLDIPDVETKRSTVGHSQVLAPDNREFNNAQKVATRLTLKAAARLRRMGYYAQRFVLSARTEYGQRWAAETSCYRANDNQSFADMLDVLWQAMGQDLNKPRLRKVSVTLYKLTHESALQTDLFEQAEASIKQNKHSKLAKTIDSINKKFGKDAVSVGLMPKKSAEISGTKIAFSRIPDIQEFLE